MIRSLVYRAALITSAIALAMMTGNAKAALIAYEGFDYPNSGSNTLISQTGGGTGWDGNWHDLATTVNASSYLVSQDDTSLMSTAFPFTPIGDRAPVTTTSASASVVRKLNSTFNMAQAGTLYGSLLFVKATGASTSSDNMEFNLVAGLSTTAGTSSGVTRIGVGSTEFPFIGIGTSTTLSTGSTALSLGTVYFMVFKIQASATSGADVLSLKIYAPGDTVPLTEPSWDLSGNFTAGSNAENALINGVRVTKGTNASGTVDEIRLGESWSDVAVVPEPCGIMLSALGAIGFVLMRASKRSKVM
jgi:hypothetical protein